jgi:Fe-Mn family superoxide dismutase
MTWAARLKRVFNIEIEQCARCGGIPAGAPRAPPGATPGFNKNAFYAYYPHPCDGRNAMDQKLTRRDAMRALTVTAAAAAAGGMAMAEDDESGAPKPLPPGKHEPVPLPFDATRVPGLSEKLLTSHWQNNYGGAVKSLNKVEEQLAGVTRDTPGFVVAGLKERELLFSNSVILHEHYFGNLGGNGKPGGAAASAISDCFGGLARWEELFRASGMSLSGGSGWTVLDLNFHTGDLRTYWSGNHTQALAFGQPLLVLDMYEHAYAIDYGASAAKYVDSFMQNVNWDQVNRRFERASRALKALRG